MVAIWEVLGELDEKTEEINEVTIDNYKIVKGM